MHGHNPDMKTISVLRHPALRAYSQCWFNRRNGVEPAPTFEHALEIEQERLRGT